MKILQLINSLSAGGAEKLLVDASIAYHKLGISTEILVLNELNSPFKARLEEFPEVKIHYLGSDINVYNPLLTFRLKPYLNNYDLIHVHLFPALYWVSMAKILGLTNKPIVLTEHSTNNKRRGNVLLRAIDKLIYKSFNEIVTISEAAKQSLEKHLGRSFNNISTIDNGVDLQTIYEAKPHERSELGFEKDNFLLIQVSSFRYPKDQKTVIKALELLPKNVHLLLVGDGPLRNENEELASQLGLKERVHFYGIRSDVPRLIKTADITMLSSAYEGLSLTSVEGLASGKPFLATDVPGLHDVVKDAGILFELGNESELAEHVNKLINDSQYYKNTVNKCQARAKKFDILNMVKNYASLYQKVLKQ